ncbi:hypothetical protein MGAD_47410 [Mycolicibacterium gadium]|uniref:Uncharacterized protein n=1 Tax=Mycolicibacterium gadium TaxID=1794 RepID=A0A7I7WRU7_MYCGU|nr:hypothetical protein MGAD_47410 [Mycolicibacterium gadium]
MPKPLKPCAPHDEACERRPRRRAPAVGGRPGRRLLHNRRGQSGRVQCLTDRTELSNIQADANAVAEQHTAVPTAVHVAADGAARRDDTATG